MLGIGGCREENGDFFLGEYCGKSSLFFWVWDVEGDAAVEDHVEKEVQGTETLADSRKIASVVAEGVGNVLSYVILINGVNRLLGKFQETLNVVEVGFDGFLGEVAELHLLFHSGEVKLSSGRHNQDLVGEFIILGIGGFRYSSIPVWALGSGLLEGGGFRYRS